MIKAEYVSCKRNVFNDIMEIEIKDIKTREHIWVTPSQIAQAVQAGLIEIKYIKVSFDGTVHITKKNKVTVADKMKQLEAEIKVLEKSSDRADREKAIKKRSLYEKLDGVEYKFRKYVASEYEEI